MPSTIVPIGTYTIRRKQTADRTDNIISPGAQSCVIVVLESPYGVGVAHIDTPFVAAQITSSMITELQEIGPGVITARLYGGDYGNPLNSSSNISNPIYAELDRIKISYSHNDYQLTCGFVMATATALFTFSPLGPESRLLALGCVLVAYNATNILKKILPEEWQPRFMGNNIDVCVNIATGHVRLVKDNVQNTQRLMCEAYRLIGGEQWRKIETRGTIAPLDPKNEPALAMLRV